ncbi:hypothetical protein B0I35DRAFT_487754 [Stachybotrys elegans]|uniref:Uncharacterized protein n=1 Tax=Stachybotrys elegans TaxID=80388 RepID=A0A8K0T104_9HYPO|nr:hypothetical protein B0I35DRAFT_487754 [Stachybotrys elegans]
MARPPNPIDAYYYKLRKHYRVTVNLSTISRRIASWSLQRQQARTKESPELIEATHDLIFCVGLTEKQTLSPYLGQQTALGTKPNYQWCIDTSSKRMDSRSMPQSTPTRVTLSYVGHSATTALSALRQYLTACDVYGFQLWYLQADRGSETPLVAAVHWNFALAANVRVEWNGQVFRRGRRLKDSYEAAPDYFGELARDGDFDGNMLDDQIAIYAVFEDVLRKELFDFVQAWNLDRIRLQKNRPHVVHVLDEMRQTLADIDIGTCLKPETKCWCRQVLVKIGYDNVALGTRQKWDKLSGQQPILAYCQARTGGFIMN